MLKWSVNVNCEVFAKDSNEAANKLDGLLNAIRTGQDAKESLVSEESFDFCMTVNVYKD